MEEPKVNLWHGRKELWLLWTACAPTGQTAPRQVLWRELNQVSAVLDIAILYIADFSNLAWINATSISIPGAVQKSAFFVHSRSFEDLTAETGEETEGENLPENSGEPEDDLQVLVGEKTVTEQHNQDVSPRGRAKEEDVSSEAWRSHRKHVFVLSEAGKPIYTRYGSEEALSSTMGVMMALVSFVEADKNIIRSIHAGQNIRDMWFACLNA